MKKMMIAASTGMLVMAAAGSLRAHHALGGYDTTKAVTVHGTVVLFQQVNPHSRLVVDEKQKDGRIHRWVVDGPDVRRLTFEGIGKDALKAGDIVEVCGYVLKDGAESQRTIFSEPPDLHLKSPSEVSISGQIMDGELLTMPDGRKQVWSDYGHHKCLGPNYADQHSTGVHP